MLRQAVCRGFPPHLGAGKPILPGANAGDPPPFQPLQPKPWSSSANAVAAREDDAPNPMVEEATACRHSSTGPTFHFASPVTASLISPPHQLPDDSCPMEWDTMLLGTTDQNNANPVEKIGPASGVVPLLVQTESIQTSSSLLPKPVSAPSQEAATSHIQIPVEGQQSTLASGPPSKISPIQSSDRAAMRFKIPIPLTGLPPHRSLAPTLLQSVAQPYLRQVAQHQVQRQVNLPRLQCQIPYKQPVAAPKQPAAICNRQAGQQGEQVHRPRPTMKPPLLMQPLQHRPLIQPLIPPVAQFQPRSVAQNLLQQQAQQYPLLISVPHQQPLAQRAEQPVQYPVLANQQTILYPHLQAIPYSRPAELLPNQDNQGMQMLAIQGAAYGRPMNWPSAYWIQPMLPTPSPKYLVRAGPAWSLQPPNTAALPPQPSIPPEPPSSIPPNEANLPKSASRGHTVQSTDSVEVAEPCRRNAREHVALQFC